MTFDPHDFVGRIDAVERRLRPLASLSAPRKLTDPDQPTGERWDWGQVWAHLAEFCPYWMREMRRVAENGGDEPVPFGRTKTDEGRIAAIERDRGVPPIELFSRLEAQLSDLRGLIGTIPREVWSRVGRHGTLGEMPMPRIVDEFLVGHLESHADQLEALLRE